MFVQSRTIARLTTGALTATVLAAGLPSAANAKVPAFPHLTLTAAKASLPKAKALPGGNVKLVDPISIIRSGQVSVCRNKSVTLHDLGRAAAVYSSKRSNAVSATGTDWALSVAVFATPAKAATTMSAIIAVERGCPTRQVYKGAGAHMGIHVTASARYATPGGWAGYRTAEQQVIYIGKTATHVTQIVVTLVRGNALVTIIEATTGTLVSPAVQEAHRKQVQTRLLAALTHPKA